MSPDLCSTTIATYVWRTDIEGVLSTQANFTRTASSLHVGTYPVYFKAKDSNNNWSQEISRTITIQAAGATQSKLYLPTVMRDYAPPFSGTFEREPNNNTSQANGPLQSGVDYHGYQNDTNDYYTFNAASSGSITIDLTNTSVPDTQLLLYYQSTANLVRQAGAAPYHLSYSGQAGLYYVRVFTNGSNNSTPYTLRVTYP